MKRLLVGSIHVHATRILVAIGATILLVLAGCKKDDGITDPILAEGPDTNKVIQLLDKQSSWLVYRTRYNLNGVADIFGPQGSMQFTQDSLISGTRWYFSPTWNYWFCQVNSGGSRGVWIKPAEATFPAWFDTTRSLIWKWPAKLGDTNSCVMYGIPAIAKVVNFGDYPVTVQGKVYKCVGYEYRAKAGNALITTMYLMPGIGWLMEDSHFRVFGSPANYEITSYLYERWWVTAFVTL